MDKEIGWLLKEKYFGVPTKNFYNDVERLRGGEPLAYIIGFTEFSGCRIDLSQKPLIPRPETEFWVGQAIKEISRVFCGRKKHGPSVLDMFAGSGCVGIAVLKHAQNAKVIFADKNKKCLEQIKINCKLNKINPDRYNVIRSDVFSNLKGKYDYIFANPPYIPKARKNRVQKAVLKHEPKNALFGGKDGLFYIGKFLKDAIKYPNIAGKIFMEFDGSAGSPQVPPQKKEIDKILKGAGHTSWEFNKDQYNRWRWVTIN